MNRPSVGDRAPEVSPTGGTDRGSGSWSASAPSSGRCFRNSPRAISSIAVPRTSRIMGQIRNFLRSSGITVMVVCPTPGWVELPRSNISGGATFCWWSSPGSSPTSVAETGGVPSGSAPVFSVGPWVLSPSGTGVVRDGRRCSGLAVGDGCGVAVGVGWGVGASVGGGTGVGSGVGTATWASGTGSGVSSTSITKMVTSILSVPPSPSETSMYTLYDDCTSKSSTELVNR